MTDSTTPPETATSKDPGAHAYLGGDGVNIDWPKVYLGFSAFAIGQFMALLDIQIVAAALAEVQAGVGATADEIGWIQSVYLLAEVITIPLSAYFSKRWGTRVFYLGATSAFIVTSVAVGLSTSIEGMILSRGLQGLAAGAMIPATFGLAMTVFPPDRRLAANVIVSMIVTLAPTIGPTLGGHIVDQLSWRWLFFLNVGPGLLVLFMVSRWGDFDRPSRDLAKGLDWCGVGLMAVFLLSMQWVLEEGADDGWFRNDAVLWLTVLSVIAGALFIWRQLTYRQPVVSLRPFTDRNFTLGVAVNFITGAALFGGTLILPLFLAHVRHYSAADVGNTMLVSGLVMFFTAPLLGRLIRLLGFRFSLFFGLLLTAWGMWQGVRVTGDWGFWEFAGLQAARGLGAMLSMIAGSQMSVATLPVSMMKDASGLLNLVRNVGGAFGMAGLSTILYQQTAEHYAQIAARVAAGRPMSEQLLASMIQRMDQTGLAQPEAAAHKAIAMMMQREASILAYGDAFAALAVACLVAAVITLLAVPAGLQPPGSPPPRRG